MKPRHRVELLPARAVAAVRLVDRRQEQRPALGEELVHHLVLRAEVVVDEPIGDARLVGDVGNAARVVALAREHPHGRVQDLAAAVGGCGCPGHQTGASTGHL